MIEVDEVAALRAALDDERAARKIAGDAADRFRDVLSECLGHADENPGDDVLVDELRAHFGKTGPEPMRWRDVVTGALAQVDQINADRGREGRPDGCTCPPGGGAPACAYVDENDPLNDQFYRRIRFGCLDDTTPPRQETE